MTTIRVGPSPIHGVGVFAAMAIGAEATIGEYTGELLSTEEADVRFANEPDCCFDGHTLQFDLDESRVLDGSVGGSQLVYVNHSPTPNCYVRREQGRIYFVAKRALGEGEELTIDYDCDCEKCVVRKAA